MGGGGAGREGPVSDGTRFGNGPVSGVITGFAKDATNIRSCRLPIGGVGAGIPPKDCGVASNCPAGTGCLTAEITSGVASLTTPLGFFGCTPLGFLGSSVLGPFVGFVDDIL